MDNNNKSWLIIIVVVILLGIGAYLLWPTLQDADIPEDVPLINGEEETVVDEGETPSEDTAEEQENQQPEEETPQVTSVQEVIDAQDQTTYVDMDVNIENATVQSVPSDRVFFVGSSLQNSIPVLLDEDLSPESEVEGQVNIQVGDTVSFTGTVLEVPSQENIFDLLGITQGDVDALLGNEVYFFVQGTQVEIISE